MKKKLPVYEFLIDDTQESGVKAVSIVTQPAFGSSAVYFAKDKPKFIELKSEGKKQIVCGFALLPNVQVYRVDPETGEEYLGYFSAETIEKIVDKYHKEMLSNQVNLNHDANMFVDGYLVEDFIVNTPQRVEDLRAKGLTHANALGAWYTAFKINDIDVFKAIVESGDATGFSVECFIERVLTDFNKEVKNNIINTKVKSEMKKINKSLKDKILSIFADLQIFERALCPELAFELEWQEVGAPVNKVIVNPDGSETLQPVGQGEFATELGIIVVDEASNLVEIRELPAQPAEETPEVPATSGDTSNELAVGETVIVPEGTEPAPSGDTPTVTGDTAQVKAGIEKSILEIVGTTDGEYTVLVKVQGGVVVEATAQSMVDLMLSKQTEIDSTSNELKLAKQRIVELEAQMKEPITDPILTPETPPVDFSKLTAYQKLMYKKGLQAV